MSLACQFIENKYTAMKFNKMIFVLYQFNSIFQIYWSRNIRSLCKTISFAKTLNSLNFQTNGNEILVVKMLRFIKKLARLKKCKIEK